MGLRVMTAVTAGDDAALTFAAYAERIGKSRPYVSKLVAQGRITVRAMTPDRKIIPALADEDIARGADPARTASIALPLGDEATYAHQRARKAAADAETAEIELARLKGDLIPRALVVETWSPRVRELRDGAFAILLDMEPEPVRRALLEDAFRGLFEGFAARLTETPTDGGAIPG